ncbi:LysR substrate-binding domain-containing protein [Chitinimonas koreensis]|uniref:LysR substrate-binding domain-containing protein n=1 Tax=Chitinimonas koreensis TaxID=356302 RepID=UPI00040992A8|nr:LysR substrate-binding domain-containing protein [Chitinimonas koreensis]QNM96080.1 LysR family transcriptional regulator [Chitinimonas koreensis]
MKRLPPLDALHVFSVVARTRNMSRAAETLFVTQSAVSRQVRQLEEHLGTALFVRQARGIELTVAGQRLLPAVEQAFDGIRRAVDALAERPTDLKFKLPPTLALRWFLPRLPDFQARHPEIEVRMSTASFSQIHFEREDFDAAIVAGTQEPADCHTELLFNEELTPACAPALAARLRTPADLAGEALIHLSPDHADWRAWLALAGVSHPALASGPSFELSDMAANVAGQGLGVAIADPLLIADDLRHGRLVTPFPDLLIKTDYRYWFACPRARRHEPAIEALRGWLRAEIEASLAECLGKS